MRTLVYDFSVLEPITHSKEFAGRVSDQIFPTFKSIFSFRRLVAVTYIDRFADRGQLKEVGRYRLIVVFKGIWVHATIHRFV